MFQLLDYLLFGIMFVSGLLAMARGFVRELLSLAAWAAAGAAGYQAIKTKKIMDLATPHFDPAKPALAQIAVFTAVFILVFIVFNVVGLRASDKVVDSRVGALDRSLGFLFGLVRGLVLVAICYLFYGWLVPAEKQEEWVRNAETLPAIRFVSQAIINHLPPDIADTLSNSSLIGNGTDVPAKTSAPDKNAGYTNGQQQGMDNLVKGTTQP